MPTALIILAAGQGTRMQSDRAKVLHTIGGVPMLVHAIAAGGALGPERRIVVVGSDGAAVAAAARGFDPEILIATQQDQRGTGHAVLAARDHLGEFSGDTLILYGDTPFIRPRTLANMAAARRAGADLVLLGFQAADPGQYGRLITDGDQVQRVVEWTDTSDQERAITLCNSGVMLSDAAATLAWLGAVSAVPASGEFYLTDIVEIAHREGRDVRVVTCDEVETQGINSRTELAQAEAEFQAAARAAALHSGVTLIAPETVHFAFDTVIGRDAVIEPHVVFGLGTTVETGAHIRAFTHIEGAHVSSGAVVGPYARLRPGTELGEGARVGNFVEIKNATLGEGAKVNHLSYVGDATVGQDSNLGAGTITCNYDGVMKHRTEIGAGVFVGSATMLVAPVRLGDGSMTGSGSVITRDVAAGELALARARQENKPGTAAKIFERLRKLKLMREDGTD